MKIKAHINFSTGNNVINADSHNYINISIGSVTNQSDKTHCKNDIINLFEQYKLTPSETTIDLLNLGVAVYTVDQLVSREKYGYYHWNRNFELQVPVYEVELWEDIKGKLSETLSFLSGDHWELVFEKREALNLEKNNTSNGINANKVSLFSGGLDSLIGAINLLHNNEKIVLVGHHRVGGREKDTQVKLISELNQNFNTKIPNFLFFVNPQFENKKNVLIGEDTQRARSFLFLVLGIAIANSIGENVPLIVPENGFISLNIPLTPTRLGTYSTKTTHPYFIFRFMDILKEIGINNEIVNPYQFHTKGEMLAECVKIEKDIITKLSNESVSCSKPNHYKRWRPKDIDFTDIREHCGHCVPCIIRRAAMKKAGIDSSKDYTYDVKQLKNIHNKGKGADLHAFKIGIEKYITQNKLSIFELLKSGALPEKDIKRYLDIAKRGYIEVQDFIFNK